MYFAAQTPAGPRSRSVVLEGGRAALQARRQGARTFRPASPATARSAAATSARAIPALRAQHSVYTVKQLNDYANGTRYPGAAAEKPVSPNATIMATIAKRLSAGRDPQRRFLYPGHALKPRRRCFDCRSRSHC